MGCIFSQFVPYGSEFDFCRSVQVMKALLGIIHIMDEGFNEIGGAGGGSGHDWCW